MTRIVLVALAVLAVGVLVAGGVVSEPAWDSFSWYVSRLETIGRLLGGILLLVGAYVAWRRVVVADEGQITDRFMKAVEQLANDQLAIRLGGIYSLERLAWDSRKDHRTVMEVLCTFVREATKPKSLQEREETIITADIRAVATVLRRRRKEKYEKKDQHLDLRWAVLNGADLNGVKLMNAKLVRASLCGAELVKADLRGADLRHAHLGGADLSGAKLSGADLRTADLCAENVTQEQLDSARGNDMTKIPPNLIRPDHWEKEKSS